MAQRIVVIGGGIVGTSIARELIVRGHKVTLVERASLGGAVTGASLACLGTHMNSRDEMEVLKWACAAWADLAGLLKHSMEYRRCGQLRFLDRAEDIPVAEDWIAFERAAGTRSELLSPEEVHRIEPLLTGRIVAATYAPDAATVTPFLAVRALIQDTIARGLLVKTHTPVSDFSVKGGKVTGVLTAEGPIEADAVVLATGPWAPDLALKIGLDLPIQPRKAQCLASVRMPPSIRCVIAACESAGGVAAGYTQIQQAPSGQILFNTVLAGGLSAAGAQNLVSEVDPDFVCNSIRQLVALFPSLSTIEMLRSWVRYEAVTPDDRFIAGPSGVPGLYLAAGDGGSGFTRAPALARVIADALEGALPPFDASVWSPSRFELATAA
ncbi:MAG: FAD-dependent oxidoreductase [Hyphomicrobiaceae bacterium]